MLLPLLFVALASAGRFADRDGELEVLSSIDIGETVCMEGLYVHDGALYQSNGWYGESALVKIDAATGAELKRFDLAAKYFAEGIALADGLIYQLTYQHKTCFVYRERSDGFELVANHTYESSEGWGRRAGARLTHASDARVKCDRSGLTFDGHNLIMSDATATLLFIDPATFRVHKRLVVRNKDGEPVTWINELEFVNGVILANHFMSQELLVINPSTGVIEAEISLANLNPARYPGCKCRCGPPTANGIAYDRARDILYVSGKDWRFYHIVKISLPDGSELGGACGWWVGSLLCSF